MASLSTYLSGGTSRTRQRRTYGTPYSYPKAYQPYSVPRRGVSGIESSSGNFGNQDLASALLQQRQVSQMSTPSSSFESSFNYDPILSKIQALSSQSVANATTNASQLRKDALIASGQVGVGRTLGFDENSLSAAGQNPESEYAQLQKEFTSRQKQLEEAMSAQNLLYSGEYTKNLSELGQGRASAEGSIGERLREMLAGIDTGLLGSQEAARQSILEAAQQSALAANYAGHPVWNPATGTYNYPTGWTGGQVDSSGSSGTSVAPEEGVNYWLPHVNPATGQLEGGIGNPPPGDYVIGGKTWHFDPDYGWTLSGGGTPVGPTSITPPVAPVAATDPFLPVSTFLGGNQRSNY